MDKPTPEAEAARKLIEALDRYTPCFNAMVEAQMDVKLYEEVSACLAEIRQAKGVIFAHVAAQSVDFVVAHTGLMTSLWNAQLSRVRGEVPAGTDGEALRAAHDEAIDNLRRACQKVLGIRRGAPRPSPSPSPGSGF